jgi:hypothetical protein
VASNVQLEHPVETRLHLPHHLPRFSRRKAFGWVLALGAALVGWVIASSPAAARARTNDIVVRLETERQNLVATTGNLLSRLTGTTGDPVANRQSPVPDEPTAGSDANEISPGSAPIAVPVSVEPCPDGMVLVEGDYCPAVVQSCLETVDGDEDRCAKYSTRTRCIGTTEPRRVCVDRYEYPNTRGMKPTAMVSWNGAKAACEAQNKRLHPSAHTSGLKGGYWGPVRDRCRATTIAHSEGFRFYQIGFRCCSDPAEPRAE